MLKGTVITILVACGVYYFLNYKNLFRKSSPIVSTVYGDVQGVASYTRDGKVFYEYLAIPYAKPPEGDLRFEPPQKPEKWEGIKDASQYGSECAQYSILHRGPIGNENCLFLNIFTKKVKENKNAKLLPVAVYVHGGAFTFGSAKMYKPDYFLDEDIVLVTINYRLGSLGFLNNGDQIQGNMGLKDQNLALKFVKENIAEFGGDPSKITLFGESAGGASVHYHILSPLSKGLFQRAITQSGLASSPWAYKRFPLEQAKRFANNVKCPTTSTKEMAKCLKNMRINELLAGHEETTKVPQHPDSMMGPSLETTINDNTFLSLPPWEIVQKGMSNPVPIISGFNSHEGLLITPTITRNSPVVEMLNNNFEEVMPEVLLYQSELKEKLRLDMKKVRDYYFGPGKSINSIDHHENITNLITDFSWGLPMEIVPKHSELASTYMYYYTYHGEFTLSKMIEAMHGQYHPAIEILLQKINELYHKYILREDVLHPGSCHADELALLFYLDGLAAYVNKNSIDYDMSKKLIKLWVSFMKDEKLQFGGQLWEPIDSKSKKIKYLKLDTSSGMMDPPFPERLQFWKNLGY